MAAFAYTGWFGDTWGAGESWREKRTPPAPPAHARKHNTNENHLSLRSTLGPRAVFSSFRHGARATYRAITVRKQTYKTESGLGVEGRKNQYPRGC